MYAKALLIFHFRKTNGDGHSSSLKISNDQILCILIGLILQYSIVLYCTQCVTQNIPYLSVLMTASTITIPGFRKKSNLVHNKLNFHQQEMEKVKIKHGSLDQECLKHTKKKVYPCNFLILMFCF